MLPGPCQPHNKGLEATLTVLAAPLIPSCPASDLFGRKGRVWLNQQPLPMDERLAVEQRLREIDRLGGEDLAAIDRLLCESVV